MSPAASAFSAQTLPLADGFQSRSTAPEPAGDSFATCSRETPATLWKNPPTRIELSLPMAIVLTTSPGDGFQVASASPEPVADNLATYERAWPPTDVKNPPA